MAQLPKLFKQDLTQDVKVRHLATKVFNADDLSNVITVECYNGSEPATLSGSVVGAVICSDGSTVPVTNGTVSGNTVTMTLTAACFAIPGPIGVGIQLVSGNVKTTIFKAVYGWERFATDNVVDPDSRITLQVADLIDDIETAIASIPSSYTDLMAAVAPTFDTSTAYTAGQYVWYDGKLYQFTTNHAAGTWNAAHAIICDIASSVSKTDSLLFSDIYPAWEQGSISTSTGENSSAQAVNNSRRVRIAETIAVTAAFDHLEVQSGLNAQIFVYSSPVVLMTNFIEAREIGQYDLTDLNGKYIRILLSKLDSTQNLTPEEVNGNTFISTFNYLDGTLTQAHKAAEAKSVGDVIARDSALHNLLYSGTMLIGYAMTSNPSSATAPTANDVMNTSDYIAVKGGETIACHGFRRYWWLDSNKAVVSNSSTGNLTDKEVFDAVSGAKLLKVPQSAAYIRVSYKAKTNEQGEADTDVYLYRPTGYDQFLYNNIFAGIGKKYVALGSSTTAGTYSEIGNPQSVGIDPNASFVRWIAEYNGYTIVNYGAGGQGWRNKSKQSAGGMNAAETIDAHYVPTANPPLNDFEDADVITLCFGSNDWKGQWGASDTDAGDGWTLGDMTSEAATDGTVIGAMKYTLEKLITAAPQAQIVVIIPGNFKKLGNAKTGDESNPEIDVVDGISYAKVENRYALGTHNIKGDTLADYHAAIKECANYYGVRFVNAGEICAANLLNIDHMLGDGIHPTPEYYKMMGYAIAPFIK